jgi:multidrug resistance protein MdtO
MAALGDASPRAAEQGSPWFWNFLKAELSPYPGRGWVVARMTVSATIVMLITMTFQIPGGFQGAIFTLIISRESPVETLRSGFRIAMAFLIGTLYIVLSVTVVIGNPLTHFLWVAISLFASFFLLRIIADYGTAAPLGFAILGALSVWDNHLANVNSRLENTLWLAGSVAIAAAVTIVVEYIFRLAHPSTDFAEGIEIRMRTIENVLRSAATQHPLDSEWEKNLGIYATVGTSRLRRLILRSGYSTHYKAQIGAAVALVGRLIDIAANFQFAVSQQAETIDPGDRQRCLRLADEVHSLCIALTQHQLPQQFERPSPDAPAQIPFLKTMEDTAALIPKVFSGTESINAFVPAPLDEEESLPIFVTDAFSNPAHLQFAMRGTLAAMVCYITYTALDWPQLSTSLLTCFITALSTIGSSRQKQVLRLSGAFLGGFVFGIGSQIFVLPYLDTITGFTLLFAGVTAISAWISTASARLSYLGVQLALTFYLINLQEFTIQTSLSIARDRVFGVLLGLLSMGVFFDLLWVRNAAGEMQAVFAANLEMFAELAEQLLQQDQIKAIRRIRQLRDQINAGFQAVTAQSDAVLLEVGPSRQQMLQVRKNIQRWQPAIRTLLQVQIAAVQYLSRTPLSNLPLPIAEAGLEFERDFAQVMRAMASEVSEKPVQAVPNIRLSAENFQREIRKHYQDLGMPVAPQASDLAGLAESLASVLSPLYEDIHATFAAPSKTVEVQRELLHDPAKS